MHNKARYRYDSQDFRADHARGQHAPVLMLVSGQDHGVFNSNGGKHARYDNRGTKTAYI
jgi:hypothetical protein